MDLNSGGVTRNDTNPKPLDGVTVIDLTRALAGPFCTLVLAGLGADVIKVEDPSGGDVARGNAPYLGREGLSLARHDDDDFSLAVLNRCRGKRSVTLDLKSPEAPGVFASLVRNADVVVENFSSGTADRLGVGYDAARQANPDVVYCSVSGFGARQEPGVRAMDALIQAWSGVMMTSGAPEDPPVRVGVPMADVITPLWGVIGILAALQRQRAGAGGTHVDVSMLGVLTSLVATEDWQALEQLGQPLRTGPTLPRLAPFGLYRCLDGWFALVAPQDKMVAPLFETMGRDDLVADPRYATREARVRFESDLTEEIESWSAGMPMKQVVELLLARGVPAAPVRTPQDAVQDSRVVARGETTAVVHPVFGTFEQLRTTGIPLQFAGTHVSFERPAPRLGEHTEEVLSDVAGYSKEDIVRLLRSGAI